MFEWKIFAAGCVGAIAPEIVRLYRLRYRRIRTDEVSNLHIRRYFIISVLFVALGGTVAVLLEASSLHAAFYMGVSLPALISAIGGRHELRNNSQGLPMDQHASHENESIGSRDDLRRRTRRPSFGFREYLAALFPPT